MSFPYVRMAGTVQRMLARAGKPSTLTREVPGTYDPTTGQPSLAATTQNVTAAVFPVGDRMIDGTNVLRGDQTAYLAAQGVEPPRPADVLAWEGRSLVVVDAKNLGPSGVFVYYELLVRGQ